jgi:NTE family protein
MTNETPPVPGPPEQAPVSGPVKTPVPEYGPALCLSGGGFRASLFHLGALRRLNELGTLAHLEVITSVSGGSITNGVLATRWTRLTPGPEGRFTNFEEEIARPVREFCGKDLRTPLLLLTRLSPDNWPALFRNYFTISGNRLAEAYEPLYRGKLAELPRPGPGTPRFVFCATCVNSGACWQIHGGPDARMGDFYTGYCDARDIKVSEAVAASSAFPLTFSAFSLAVPRPGGFSRIDPWGRERPPSPKRGGQFQGDSARCPILLTDGGVYDNLGVEPVWGRNKTLLISNAGAPLMSVASNRQTLVSRLARAAGISAEQVGAVRLRWLVDQMIESRRQGAKVMRTGTVWSLDTNTGEYPGTGLQGYGDAIRALLTEVRTDLNRFTDGEIACLENHGYSLADAAMRSYAPELCPNPAAPFQWPQEGWRDEERARRALRHSDRLGVLHDIGRLFVRLGRH